MARADNSRFLVDAAGARHRETLRRARAAIERLDRSGGDVSFTAVAAAARVSRAWLYRHPEIRSTIMRLRSVRPSSGPPVPAQQRASTDSLRQRLEASREEIVRLRSENAVLRDQLARALGQLRSER